MMEEHLQRLVELAERRLSGFPILLTGRQTKISTEFQPTFQLPSGNYEMALNRLETYYSFPNINPENSHFRISIDKGKTWTMMSIPTGSYDITAVNATVQRLIEENGGRAKMINILPDVNTLKCILDIKNENYQIDFTVDNCL